jgi:SAM-dependent methyltransferase
MMRTACGACAGTNLATFLDLGKTPLANKFPAAADEDETFYPLQLGRCGNCGLVQGMEIIPDDVIYGDDYGFYSGASQAQRDYHKAAAALLLGRHGDLAQRLTVEVACNDGSMLQHFGDAGCKVLGVDPAGPSAAAVDKCLPVLQEPFTADLGRVIRDRFGPAGLVIVYNALAHVGDLSDVLTGIWSMLAPDGVAVVEVQYLPDLIAGNLIGQVYHEHRYFYSLTSFQRAAELHGLHVVDAELIELQGGGIRFTLSNDASRVPHERVQRIAWAERWLNSDGAYAGVQGRIDRNRDHLLDILEAERAAGRLVAGYAAAAKAATILNYYGITPEMLPYVADTTPYKHGRYVPGVKIPIVSADVAADTRFLLTSNYLGWLLRTDREFLDRGGRWLICEPSPVRI